MTQCCFICNTKTSVSLRNACNLFGDDASLSSGKNLPEVIGDIVEKQIKEENIHASIICKKCSKTVVEYDSLQVRVKAIKAELLLKFKSSLQKRNINYDNYNKDVPKIIASLGKNIGIKKLVLPASKLQPLPPDFIINKKWPMAISSEASKLKPTTITLPSSNINLKVTVGSSVLTQNINLASTKKPITQTIDPKLIMTSKATEKNLSMKSEESTSSTFTLTQPISSVSSKNSNKLSFNVNSLPKDFLSSAIMTKCDDYLDNMKKEGLDNEENDDSSMEVEDCSLAVLTANKQSDKLVFETDSIIKSDANNDQQYLDVRLVGTDGSTERCVLGKLEILRDEQEDQEEDEHTILLEDGSIYRVMGGQKFLYGDSEISIVPDDLDNNDGDSQDSNDDSQIELQVSGDEETANAIIAAAKEQGGAFIKVESGEMYRVESVESKANDVQGDNIMMVAHEDGQFRCLLCENNDKEENAFISDAESTMKHLKIIHSARIYICMCGHICRKRADYVTHIEEHAHQNSKSFGKMLSNIDKAKVHECNICKKKYSSKTLLNEHKNMHSGSRPYTCDVCGKSFASKYTHQSHLKTHLVRPRPFKCSQCGKSFFTLQNLNQHEKTHSGIKDFICNICGKAFGTQHNLEVHGVVHSGNKPFLCGVCGKGFARRAEVRDHMRIHTGERPFSCDICGARFTQRSNLYSHKRATHLDDKRYGCTLCPKRFKRRRLLDYHIKASHTGERPLKCEICRATFVYPEHFKKHATIHSGEKPYTCEVCGKSFNSRDNRNTHRFVHSDRKPYECVVCGAGYMRKQLLYHHMNTSGHLAESIVVNQPRVTKVPENVLTTQVDASKAENYSEAIYQAAEELQLDSEKAIEAETENATKFFITGDKKILMQDGKSTLNLVQDGEEPTLLTLHNIEDGIKADETSLGLSTEEQPNHAIQLVPIELADGTSGWVALNS